MNFLSTQIGIFFVISGIIHVLRWTLVTARKTIRVLKRIVTNRKVLGFVLPYLVYSSLLVYASAAGTGTKAAFNSPAPHKKKADVPLTPSTVFGGTVRDGLMHLDPATVLVSITKIFQHAKKFTGDGNGARQAFSVFHDLLISTLSSWNSYTSYFSLKNSDAIL